MQYRTEYGSIEEIESRKVHKEERSTNKVTDRMTKNKNRFGLAILQNKDCR